MAATTAATGVTSIRTADGNQMAATLTTPPPTLPKLPAADSATLELVPATAEQARQCWALNGPSWRGPLTLEAYVRREKHLGAQELTRNGGITYWVLIDSAEQSADPLILSACESYLKPAFVARRRKRKTATEGERQQGKEKHGDSGVTGDGGSDHDDNGGDSDGDVQTVASHVIGSVYCRDAFRGRGYAGRMMNELRKKLETWQQPAGKKAAFNVLYSDIGKRFYAKYGWMPYTSSHVCLPAEAKTEADGRTGRPGDHGAGQPPLPATKPIYTQDLQALCEADAELMRRSVSDFSGSEAKVRVALVPGSRVMGWMHSREEFLAEELGKSDLRVKGALVNDAVGQRVWCVWWRRFSDDSEPDEAILYVSRIVDESRPAMSPTVHGHHRTQAEATAPPSSSSGSINAIAACLRAAQHEAARVGLTRVEVWNPSPETLAAARKLFPEARLTHREEESITSLLWYGDGIAPGELEWIGNEKYGWS